METKQKTWEDCRNEVAQKYDCSDWEMLMLNLKQSDIRKTEFEVTKEAAELYNQETAKERDSYKSGAEQWKATSKYQEDEINNLREASVKLQLKINALESDNERLKELSDRWGIELLKLLGMLKSITLSMKVHPDCTEGSEFDGYVRLSEKLLSKASDGYTKAKD